MVQRLLDEVEDDNQKTELLQYLQQIEAERPR